MSVYNQKPQRFLERLSIIEAANPMTSACCAGFELAEWRCMPFAKHLIEWLPEYALPEDELNVNHGNMYVKLQQAAVRVYTSEKYKNRGEAGEIALHAICRDFFDTIPISPRVFYKSTSNDVIKSFDMVHARFPDDGPVELWLGESKFYADPTRAIKDAISSVQLHLEKGFLENQKLILGPQIPKTTPRYEEIMQIFRSQSSLDRFINSSVFVVGIIADSLSVKKSKSIDEDYKSAIEDEIKTLKSHLDRASLYSNIKVALFYIPIQDKKSLVRDFDMKLKGLQ